MRIIEVLGTDVDRGTNCKEGIQAPPSLRNFCIEAISRQSRCFAGGRRGLLHAVVSHSLADPDPYGALALIPEDQLILTLREYLAFLVPGQSNALVDEIRIFLNHKEVVGPILLVTLLFFSALAFTILENAMSVIFYHRVKSRRRHFLTSALMPYLFILFLGVGLLIVTILAGMLQVVGGQSITVLGHVRSLDQLSIFLLYLVGVTGEMLLLSAIYFIMPVGRLSVRHALLGGVTARKSVV